MYEKRKERVENLNLAIILAGRHISDLMSNQKIGQLDFEQFFKEHYPVSVALAVRFVHDLDMAREIAQQTFVNLYEKKDYLEVKSSLKAYLMQSVRNSCLNHLSQNQTRQKHHKLILHSQTGSADQHDHLEYSELEHKIYKIIESLPEKCKLIFKMNRFDGKKNKDIADELNISKRTVETQISKALKILRAEIRVPLS